MLCGSGQKGLQASPLSCSVKELPAKEPGRPLESQELSRIAGKGKVGFFVGFVCFLCLDHVEVPGPGIEPVL